MRCGNCGEQTAGCCKMDASDFGHVHSHAWVLVDFMLVEQSAHLERVLWACPCGEFKWTSFAEWERGQNSKIAMAEIEADLRRATPGQGFTASQGLGSP